MSLKPYCDSIENIAHLTKAREWELFRRIQAGDWRARNELVEAVLMFAVRTIGKTYRVTRDREDCIQDGSLWLLERAHTFDPSFGSVATWARRNLRWSMLHSYSDNRLVRMNDTIYWATRKRCKDGTADDEDRKKMAAVSFPSSLNVKLKSGDSSDHEFVDTRDPLGQAIDRDYYRSIGRSIVKALRTFRPRVKFVLYNYLRERRGSDIASKLGISKQAVQQLYEQNFGKLKERIKYIYVRSGGQLPDYAQNKLDSEPLSTI